MLGNPAALPLPQTLAISLCGFCIVFLCLGALILAIKLLGWLVEAVISRTGKDSTENQQDTEEETCAVLLAAVSAESGLPPDKIQIEHIHEIK